MFTRKSIMKYINNYLTNGKIFSKMKVIASLIFSYKFIVIAIKKNERDPNVKLDFHTNVTNTELTFYTNYIIEYIHKCLLIAHAKKIIDDK